MSTSAYSRADFLSALQALLPRGKAWPRDPDSVQSKALSGLTPIYERQTARANQLLADAFPATAYELLPEWEQALGLPDSCIGAAVQTIQQRRAQVVARFTGTGGQSLPYFTAYAANLGYVVTVENDAPFRVGQSAMGAHLGVPEWFFTWSIIAPLNSYTSFRMGQSAMGEPLESWGNAALECSLNDISPAHSILQFHYQ